jgi:glycosyltransferase involved in cell wall biosynthesis
MKKVLIFTYYWPPSGGAGVQRWVKFSKYLLRSGIKPLIITVDEKKASYPLRDHTLLDEIPADIVVYRTKTFEPFNLYKAFTKSKEIPFGGFANESEPGMLKKISRFIRGNFFIPDARIGWNTFAFKQALQVMNDEKPSIVITTSPPHSTQLIGLRIKEKYGIPWIADLRDPWTEIYYYDKMMHTKYAREKDLLFERVVLEKADAIIVVSRHIRDAFLRKSPLLNAAKFHIIPNGFDTDDFKEETEMNPEMFVITYTGTITADYRLQGFLGAVKNLIQKYGKKILFRFVGSLPSDVKESFLAEIPQNFENIQHVSHSKAISYMKKASVLLLAIPDTDDNKGILTGKLFEYLASRRPVIGIGPGDGEASEILEYCGAGQFFDYDDKEGIFEELERMYSKYIDNQQFEINASHNYLEFSRQNQALKLSQIIDSLSV